MLTDQLGTVQKTLHSWYPTKFASQDVERANLLLSACSVLQSYHAMVLRNQEFCRRTTYSLKWALKRNQLLIDHAGKSKTHFDWETLCVSELGSCCRGSFKTVLTKNNEYGIILYCKDNNTLLQRTCKDQYAVLCKTTVILKTLCQLYNEKKLICPKYV